ncbi:27477_t:CDS:1, partial [Dentiscutata erythropus]
VFKLIKKSLKISKDNGLEIVLNVRQNINFSVNIVEFSSFTATTRNLMEYGPNNIVIVF